VPSKSFLDQLAVVLVNARNPLNIGTVARALTNFGFSDLRVVNPYEVAFRNAKSAVGAAAVLRRAKEFSSVADAVADCNLVIGTTAGRHRKLEHPLHPLPQGAKLIRRKLQRGKVALLFGSERRGLSNEDLSHCDWLICIPTQPEQPSMNLGHAVAVCLYELSRASRVVAVSDQNPASSSADMERLTELLHECLVVSGFAQREQERELERRFIRRLKPSARDATVLLGMLRQMLWKMRNR
jgi:tRNA/rRNA methyltransferase